MQSLPQKYNHGESEKKWQDYWLAHKTFAWDSSQPRANTYVIDTPPPTVSGLLHMGHVYSYCHADFIARFQRMNGKTVFYPIGFDDNGLPTERLVEKVKKIKAPFFIKENGREAFIDLCKDVVEEAEADFRSLFRSIALSVDWDNEYQTISEHSRKISQMSFLDLFHKEEVTRKLQPMLWDPVDQTALAQAEVEDKEVASTFNDIIFGIEGSDKTITIGTTRPELIPACVAVFYHPEDERYQHLKGKNAITPLFGVKVPIMEDDTVEPDKGTGIMMCCTFGDEKDIEKWRKHNLPARVILNKYGKIGNFNIAVKDTGVDVRVIGVDSYNDELDFNIFSDGSLDYLDSGIPSKKIADPRAFIDKIQLLIGRKARPNTGNKGESAREKILEWLDEAGLLVESKPIMHMEPCAERSSAPLEILPTQQWFVKVLDKKQELLDAAQNINWHPDYMKVRLEQWINGLSWDWCISRQRYFGVPFPVWYSKRAGEEGKVLVAHPDDLPVNPLKDLPRGYTADEVEADPDVMDTWATSSASPQINSHAITKDYALDYGRHEQLYPADLRSQAHEIIRTWLFYTLTKSYLHENKMPWSNVMISGWCLAADKSKMSKSKGNTVTPVDLIRDKGSDAVRYWASTARLGTDTAFSEDVLKIGNKLVNKLWNASKFASLHFDTLATEPTSAADDVKNGIITEALDKWILSRLNKTVRKAEESFANYEYSHARSAVEDFFWNDFCDNYLELAKARAYAEEGSDEAKRLQKSAVHTLYHCLEAVLKLFAPFVPHITEEIYSYIFDTRHAAYGSIHARGTWPKAQSYPADKTAEASGVACLAVLEAIRKLKSVREVSIRYPLENVTLSAGSSKSPLTWDIIAPAVADLKNAVNATSIVWSDKAAGDAQETENGEYAVLAEFAASADAA